jgi:dipeptidyl aminopeptidase/acylaminoacyl peptidase
MRRVMQVLLLSSLLTALPLSSAPAQTAAATTSEARPAKIPALNFAKGSGLSDIMLSPDGAQIALRATIGEKEYIALVDPVTRKALSKVGLPDKAELEWFRWAGNGKLLVSMSAEVQFFGEDARITRLYLYDLANATLSFVGKVDMGLNGDDVIHVDPEGKYVLLAMQRTIYDWPSVWRFELDGTGPKGGKQWEKERNGVWGWIADNAGVVRMGLEPVQGGRKLKLWYRSKAGDPLKLIAKLTEDTAEDELWDVLRIVSNSDEGLVLKPDATGRMAVRKFNYATRTAGDVVFAVPGWDVQDMAFDDNDTLIAAFYSDDRDRVAWFEPKMKRLQARLDKALTGMEVWVASRAKDNSRMVVWAGSEADPGGYFIYDAAQAKLDAFFSNLPGLDPAGLAQPKPVSYTARDGTKISAYLTLPRGRGAKDLPLIVLPHGGPYGVRDKLDFSAEVQFLANRGYAVLQPNYRGSGGYGEPFDELGQGQIGRAMQDDLDDAMDWAVKEGVADAKRVCVVGSSYGGYAALWAVTRNPERYRCAASFAGVTDWDRILKYDDRFFTRKGARKWRARVKGDDAKFDLAQVSPLAQIARLTRPVLLVHGDADTRVPFKQFTLYRDAAFKAGKPVETLVFKDEGHNMDRDENRAKWYEALDAFLAKHNPAE